MSHDWLGDIAQDFAEKMAHLKQFSDQYNRQLIIQLSSPAGVEAYLNA